MRRTARKAAGRVCECPEGVLRGPVLRGLRSWRGLRSCAGRSCTGSGPQVPRASRAGLWLAGQVVACAEAVDDPVEKSLLRGTTWPSLWTFCGQRKNLEISAANPCATRVPGSRNTSLPETGTTPGATPERRKNRETGTSRGYPVPAAGRLTNRPPGNQRASGQRPGQAPASHTCRGLAYFRARPIPRPGPFPGLANPRPGPFRAQLARSAPSARPRSPCC